MHISPNLNRTDFFKFNNLKKQLDNNYLNKPLLHNNFDTVSFGARRLATPVEKRMTDYAVKLLQNSGIKKGHPDCSGCPNEM